MALHVDVISDVICPWCYIGKRRLEKAVAALGGQHKVRVRWLSFQGRPLLKVADTLLTPDQQSVNHIAHRLKGQLSQLHLEKNAIPLFGPILGVVLIVAGVMLLRGPRRRRAAVQAAPAREHEETAAP